MLCILQFLFAMAFPSYMIIILILTFTLILSTIYFLPSYIDGQAINIIDSGVTLTHDLRNAAVNHLHGLQSQVAALVSKLYGQ